MVCVSLYFMFVVSLTSCLWCSIYCSFLLYDVTCVMVLVVVGFRCVITRTNHLVIMRSIKWTSSIYSCLYLYPIFLWILCLFHLMCAYFNDYRKVMQWCCHLKYAWLFNFRVILRNHVLIQHSARRLIVAVRSVCSSVYNVYGLLYF